jgi:hypothetical protein
MIKKPTFFFSIPLRYSCTWRVSKQCLCTSFYFSLFFYFFCLVEKECKYFYGSNRHHREPNQNGYTVVPIARTKNIA